MNLPRPLVYFLADTLRRGFRLDVDTLSPAWGDHMRMSWCRNMIEPGSWPRATSVFHAVPRDIATALYYTGIDPFTKQQVYVAKGLKDRKMQRALMQFFKPENYFQVREALLQAERQHLIGSGCDCLIPAQPPMEAAEVRSISTMPRA